MGRGVDLQAHIRHTKVLPLSSTRPLARSASKRSFSDGGGAAPELIVRALVSPKAENQIIFNGLLYACNKW